MFVIRNSWQWTMTSRFWLPVAIYHSYHWPHSIWYYWTRAPIWGREGEIFLFSCFVLLLYSMLIWIPSFCSFSVFSFWFILPLPSVRYEMCSGSELRRLCVLPGRVQQAFHASHIGLLFSFSHAPTLIWALSISTWTTNCLLIGPCLIFYVSF